MIAQIISVLVWIVLSVSTILAFVISYPYMTALRIYMASYFMLNFCMYAIIKSDIKLNKKVWIMRLSGLFLTLYTLCSPVWWHRLLAQCMVLTLFQRPLKNKDEYDNSLSCNNTYIYSLLLAYVINIVRLSFIKSYFNVEELLEYLLQKDVWCEILTIIIPIFLYVYSNGVIKSIKEYDILEEKALKQYQERKNRYENSSYALSTKLSYEEVMNDKGNYGEYVASTYLTDIKHPYRVLFSVCIPVNDEIGSTEIDMIVITNFGIKCLEVKNKAGKWRIIEGEKIAKIKYSDRYGYEETQSPLNQNKNHIKALKTFLWENELYEYIDYVGGYLVFGPDTLGWEIESNSQGYCSYKSIGELINSNIEKNNKIHRPYISDNEIEDIYNFLSKYEDPELRDKHKLRVKFYHDNN